MALFIEELTAEWNRLTGDRSEALTAKRRDLAKVERKVAGLIDAIADGLRTQGLRERLEALEARRAVLAREVADQASQGSSPRPGRSVPHAGGAPSRPTAHERPAGGHGGAAGTDNACQDTPS